jgi:diguanylate cyclase (GGDEF)-like protein
MSINLNELRSLGQDLKILYIEDDIDARNGTLQLLENFFKNITTANDGVDGAEKFRKGNYDIILSDIMMPNLNGLEMLRIIREEDEEVHILLLSAYNDSQYFLEAIELDIDGYILKPIVYEQFLKALYKTVKKIHLIALSNNYKTTLEEEVKKIKEEIEYKLYYDPLTNLFNRYSFFKDLELLSSPIVLLIDIDKFNVINEVYGSEIGSKVLKKFAACLHKEVQIENCSLYRLSADEFAVVDSSQYIDTDKHESLLENLLLNCSNLRLEIEKHIITIDITIGLSSVEKNGYESAKIALDHAKKYKKPFVMYSTEIDHRQENSATLKCKENIASAINDKRVVAVYQPIVDKDKKLVKYETLMRLKEEESLKLMSPFYFLDVAIKTRLYEHLSSTVIFKALNLINEKKVNLSMNLTYSDIKNTLFVKKMEEFISTHEGVGERVVFEITESESIENYDDVKNFISRFRKHGVKIAIDDFGSGFSNFEYILEIEPDYLKIDGSIVKDIDKDERAHTLVEAIVQFSHKLGIKVIAEYVHSQTIFEMLLLLEVDEYQGYYFSEPLEKIVL